MAKADSARDRGDLQDIMNFADVVLTVRPDKTIGAVEIVVKAGAAKASLCLSPASAYRLAAALTTAAAVLPVPEMEGGR